MESRTCESLEWKSSRPFSFEVSRPLSFVDGSNSPIEPLTTRRYRLGRSTRLILHSGLVFSPRHGKAPVWRLHFLLKYGGSSERVGRSL